MTTASVRFSCCVAVIALAHCSPTKPGDDRRDVAAADQVSVRDAVDAVADSGFEDGAVPDATLVDASIVEDSTPDATAVDGADGADGSDVVDVARDAADVATDTRPDSGLPPVVSLAVGYPYACALLGDNRVRCWGGDGFGERADGVFDPSSVATTATSLSAVVQTLHGGFQTSCARSGDRVVCWGSNLMSQLGRGAATFREAPGFVLEGMGVTLAGITSLSYGAAHGCARKSDGTLRCWGSNNSGQLGINRQSATAMEGYAQPVLDERASGADAGAPDSGGLALFSDVGAGSNDLALGELHSCARKSDGRVYCWGLNAEGQAGGRAGETFVLTPREQTAILDSSAVYAGGSNTCVVYPLGRQLACWGSNASGQLANGGTSVSLTPIVIPSMTNTIAVGIGRGFICAIRGAAPSDTVGQLYCWGRNDAGQLGDRTFVDRPAPVAVPGFSRTKSLSVGYLNACAIREDDSVHCWGSDQSGQVGSGRPVLFRTPTRVDASRLAASTQFERGAASMAQTCATTSDRTVACWGENASGQTASGGREPSPTPALAMLPAGFLADEVAAGFVHTCARGTVGSQRSIACWGSNRSGALGVAATTTIATTGTTVSSFPMGSATALSGLRAGGDSTCVIVDGSPRCWGANFLGQLGVGDTVQRNAPTPLAAPFGARTDVVEIAPGSEHTCARTADGRIYCFGRNAGGSLGDGSMSGDRSAPGPAVDNTQLTSASAIAVSSNFSCAIRSSDGAVFCWGSNIAARLGDGTATNRATPVRAGALTNALQIGLGSAHGCALLQNDEVWCWGDNSGGQLARPASTAGVASPVLAGTFSQARSLVVGTTHACVVHGPATARVVSCWGSNALNQSGVGGPSNVSDPVAVRVVP